MQIEKLKFPEDYKQVCDLLQKTMRPKNLPFPIQEEYPIVLDPQSGQYSYGIKEGDQILAHVNFWTRTLANHSTKIQIALIGNVATHPDWQGQGLMKRVFSFLEEIARQQKIHALLLWSDLDEFYHGLGYRSLGQEWLYQLQARKFRGNEKWKIAFPNSGDLSHSDLQHMIDLRPKLGFTLDRSPAEFSKMLQIPLCKLCTISDHQGIAAYAILGKGYDMQGIIHEWGSRNPDLLRYCTEALADHLGYRDYHILSPYYLDSSYLDLFNQLAVEKNLLDMAWYKAIDPKFTESNLLEQSFIWGLDSI